MRDALGAGLSPTGRKGAAHYRRPTAASGDLPSQAAASLEASAIRTLPANSLGKTASGNSTLGPRGLIPEEHVVRIARCEQHRKLVPGCSELF